MMSRDRARLGSLALFFTGLAMVGVACGGEEFASGASGAGGTAGSDASAGGSAGSQTDGSAGSQGGAAQGGAPGKGGSSQGGAPGEGGSSQGGTGANGQGGSGASTGEGGSGAMAGSGGGCGIDLCTLHTVPVPQSCSPCATAVCAESGNCCTGQWGPYCALLAHKYPECGCGIAACEASTVSEPSGGACLPPGAACNPLGPTMCPSNAHCSFELAGGFSCRITGPQEACKSCTASSACAPGLSCVVGQCVYVCCADSDCAPGAICKGGMINPGSTFGICVTPPAGVD